MTRCGDGVIDACDFPKKLAFSDNKVQIIQEGYAIFSLCLATGIELNSYQLFDITVKPGKKKDVFSEEDFQAVFIKGDSEFYWRLNSYSDKGENLFFSNSSWFSANPVFFNLNKDGKNRDLQVYNPGELEIKLNILLAK